MASFSTIALRSGLGLAAIAVVGLLITRPEKLEPNALEGLVANPENGALVYAAMGCASCHSAPEGVEYPDGALGGGKRFPSPFGTFVAPNISTHPTTGIGAWSDLDIANAVLLGTSPSGEHLYPAFPYATYTRAELQDVVDLIAHLRSLPAVDTPNEPHEISFPMNMRVLLGGWKLLFLDRDWIITSDLTPEQERGRYLVEAMGHCGECHTPRNVLGGMITSEWLAGAANAAGEGRIPNITTGDLEWSAGDVAEYLSSGFTPEFDTAGAEMAEVIENTSQLPQEDRDAIAAYLQIVPPHENK
ncbi:c-type cytochrome [Falsihalocynthiibacter sp. SS001]|uniref:c-type cytochrome n=1 Tax=Falsihalocynthiibacter sp. SS001 TaxID=3349698 RepID=UPI0036D3F854